MGVQQSGRRRLLSALLCVLLVVGSAPAFAASPSAFQPLQDSSFEVLQDDAGISLVGECGADAVSALALFEENFRLMPGTTYTVLDADGSTSTDGAVAATGMAFVASTPGDGEIGRATLVLLGDVTGSGKVALSDIVTMARAMLNVEKLEGPYLAAGDWNRSGAIELSDLVRETHALRDSGSSSGNATPPTAEAVDSDEDIYEYQWATLTAEGVKDDDGVSRVWFVVTSPDGTSKEFDAASQPNGNWTTQLSWLAEFESPGSYTATGHASDVNGSSGELGSVTVEVLPGAVQGHDIMGESQCTVEQLMNEQLDRYGWDNAWYRMTVEDFCRMYYDLCEQEGVRAEVAYAQMIHETGGLRYGNLVVREQKNFAGMGSSGNTVAEEDRKPNHRYSDDGRDAGLIFTTVENGIKSHIQHLKGYATTDELALEKAPEYDRFGYIDRGCAPVVEKLAGTWAYGNPKYGELLLDSVGKIMRQSTEMPDYDHEIPPEVEEGVVVKVSNGDTEVLYQLNDSTAAKAFAAQLPRTMELNDDRGTRKWSHLLLEFDPSGSTRAECTLLYPGMVNGEGVGMLAYDSLFGQVDFYYSGFSPRDDLFAIGQALDSENANKVFYLDGPCTVTVVE